MKCATGASARVHPAVRWAAGLWTLGLLVPVQLAVHPPMLLAERFLPGAGFAEIGLLGLYAAWLAGRLLDPERGPAARRGAWLVFSVVFFGQFLLGLAGLEECLMTGQLHLPVPAVVVAGPLYRGGGWFMPLLFLSAVLLLGPAWCSHLCYLGAWDNLAAERGGWPRSLPAWAGWLRVGLLAGVLGTALWLRGLGAGWTLAAGLGLGFGLAGVGVLVGLSRRRGLMVHCLVWCPLGLLADLLGRLSPWRLSIAPACIRCGACGRVCRYDALRPVDLARGRPALSCSLCGDCLSACPDGHLSLRLAGRGGAWVRSAFVVLAAGLHAAFLGLARV